MNTSCTWWYDDDDGGHACKESTRFGRTHCHVHRVMRIKQLAQAKAAALLRLSDAVSEEAAYLNEGI